MGAGHSAFQGVRQTSQPCSSELGRKRSLFKTEEEGITLVGKQDLAIQKFTFSDVTSSGVCVFCQVL